MDEDAPNRVIDDFQQLHQPRVPNLKAMARVREKGVRVKVRVRARMRMRTKIKGKGGVTVKGRGEDRQIYEIRVGARGVI